MKLNITFFYMLGWAALIAACWFHLGCEAANTTGGADADTDVDTDTDTDTDSDGDTDYNGPSIPETCEDAALAKTSVGCEFFTADLDNYGSSDDQIYGIVVSNPQADQQAEVTLEDGNTGQIYQETLAPGQLEVIYVTCTPIYGVCLLTPHEIEAQGVGFARGFRLSSDVPVLAYQWNPYGNEFWTSDASLLIPVTSLDGTYIAAAWDFGPWGVGNYASQVTVIAAEDDTSITFIPNTDVPSHGGVGPMAEGVVSAPITLNAFDVVTIGPAELDDDLTGTVVMADKPVVVFGGHSCAFVPGSAQSCDHVEEQLLPLAAWGTTTVLARHAPRPVCTPPNSDDPVLWRIIAGADDMHVTFDPPAPDPAGAEHHFAEQGELLEFMSTEDHYAEGILDDPPDPAEPEASFFAYQMMTGCMHCNPSGTGDFPPTFEDQPGDPMMLFSPPAGQFLDRYVFNTDNVYDFDYDHIIIVRPIGTEVTLDCLGVLPDSSFDQVGSSDWEVGRIFIDNPENSTGCLDGTHLLTSADPVGLSVVGVAPANSYGYLGGIGVKSINPDPIIE